MFIHVTARSICAGLACFLASLLLTASPSAAQDSGREIIAELQEAMSAGDVETVLGRVGDRVDISLFGSNAIYSRSQARYVLRDFFRQHPPRRFVFQNPSQREDSWFATGELWPERADEPFQVFVRLRQQQATWELREIRIDRSTHR